MFQKYLLNIRTYVCNFELYINDVLVQHEYNDNYLTFETKINQWLKGRENILKVKVLPLKNSTVLQPRARVEAQIINLIIDPKDNSKIERVKVLELNTFDIQFEGLEKLPSVECFKPFVLEDKFVLPWLDAPAFQLSKQNQMQILDLYKQIHRFFLEKNISGIMNLLKQKNISCAKALNTPEIEFLSYVEQGFKEIWNDPNNELWPLEKQELIPHYYAAGKLVSVYNELLQPIILYYNQHENSSIFIDIFIMNSKDDKLIIIR